MTTLQEIYNKKLTVTESAVIRDDDLVKQIQTRLKSLGHYNDNIDGIWGRRTEQAIAEFCQEHNLNNATTNIYGAYFAEALIEAQNQMLITGWQAHQIFGSPLTEVELSDLNECLQEFKITTAPRIRHFLAHVGHESAGLRYCKELASGWDYEGRTDLGNTQSGDGPKFKGTGWIQVTGRYWHQKFADAKQDPRIIEIGVDYTSVHYPASISGCWWLWNEMNDLCDRGASLKETTRRVNGGLNGYEDRYYYYQKACQFF